MKHSKKQKEFAQNSIDYIVYNNPVPVRKLLYDCGYESPKNIHHLVEATKELVQKNGKSIITQLLAIHPDKKAILAVQANEKKKKGSCNACNNDSYHDEDNFCSSCGHSNYMGLGDEDSFLDQFSDTSDAALEKYYARIVKKSNKNPEDQKLAGEVQVVWNELRQRRLLQPEDHQENTKDTRSTAGQHTPFKREELLWIGMSFLGGFVVCSVLKK